MNLPPIDNLAVLQHVIVRMLGGGQAGVVCENADPVADFNTVEYFIRFCVDLAMFLRQRVEPYARIFAVKIQNLPIAERRIKRDRAAVL